MSTNPRGSLRRLNSAIADFVKRRFSRKFSRESKQEKRKAQDTEFSVDESVATKHLYKRSWVPVNNIRSVSLESECSFRVSVESSHWSSITDSHSVTGNCSSVIDTCIEQKTESPSSQLRHEINTCLSQALCQYKNGAEKVLCNRLSTPSQKTVHACSEIGKRSDATFESGLQSIFSPSTDASSFPRELDFERDIKLVRYLGGGSAASVYQGIWQNRIVAVKLFHGLENSLQTIQSFHSEVAVLSKLNHKHIIRFIAASTALPHLCILQELAEQGSIHDMIHEHHVRPQYGKLLQILSQIASAMQYCHHLSIPVIHRDLKTKNVLLDKDGNVLLADFGISRFKENSVIQTNHPQAGTVTYSAPELFRNEAVTEKCDVYSFGVILWECLTGRRPWEGRLPMQVVMTVAVEKQHLPIPRNCPLNLETLVLRCFEQDPDLRPSFQEIQADLYEMTRQLTSNE